MNPQTIDEVRRTVAEVFLVDEASVTVDTSAESLPAWDSMGHLNLILALEQKFDRTFDPEVVPQLTSVASIAAAIDGDAS